MVYPPVSAFAPPSSDTPSSISGCPAPCESYLTAAELDAGETFYPCTFGLRTVPLGAATGVHIGCRYLL
jgi:hypothetical protein